MRDNAALAGIQVSGLAAPSFQIQSFLQKDTPSLGKGIPKKKKKKNFYIFSSQLGIDQVTGPPREGQLMCTLFPSTHQ